MAIPLSRRSWRSNEGHEKFSSEPELVGYYSVDGDNTYLPDSSKLSYYKPRDKDASRSSIHEESVNFDLNRDRESITRRYSPNVGKLLFTWITLNHDKIQAPAESGRWIEPNFVCDSGLLYKLLITPYAVNEGWIIRAAKWKGTIYLTCSHSSSSRGFEMPANASKKLCDWALNFDQYMQSDNSDETPDAHRPTVGSDKTCDNSDETPDAHRPIVGSDKTCDFPNEKPNAHRPIVGSGEFRGVYKLRFGDNTVLFDAAIRAVISERPLKDPLPLKDLECVQLAMVKDVLNDRQKRSFRQFKLLKWWCHGFLTNTEKCVCGFRDDDGIVHRLVTYTLEQIIEMAKSYWKPSSCVDFCESFIGILPEIVVDDCFKTIYTFERKPYEDGFHLGTMLPSSRYTVIPPSFIGRDR